MLGETHPRKFVGHTTLYQIPILMIHISEISNSNLSLTIFIDGSKQF